MSILTGDGSREKGRLPGRATGHHETTRFHRQWWISHANESVRPASGPSLSGSRQCSENVLYFLHAMLCQCRRNTGSTSLTQAQRWSIQQRYHILFLPSVCFAPHACQSSKPLRTTRQQVWPQQQDMQVKRPVVKYERCWMQEWQSGSYFPDEISWAVPSLKAKEELAIFWALDPLLCIRSSKALRGRFSHQRLLSARLYGVATRESLFLHLLVCLAACCPWIEWYRECAARDCHTADLMLGQRQGRWPNIKSTLCEYIMPSRTGVGELTVI